MSQVMHATVIYARVRSCGSVWTLKMLRMWLERVEWKVWSLGENVLEDDLKKSREDRCPAKDGDRWRA